MDSKYRAWTVFVLCPVAVLGSAGSAPWTEATRAWCRTEHQAPRMCAPLPAGSCAALRSAVTALYALDDFSLEKIGSGFFSDVYKAVHVSSGRVMALKLTHSGGDGGAGEVQLLARLRHPHVVRLVGAVVHAGRLHALTELLSGSLAQLLRSAAPLRPGTRVALATQVSSALRYLHQERVFHRDLTADNVLLRPAPAPHLHAAVVADLGLAAPLPRRPRARRLPSAGSPWWMSPECLRGRRYDHRSDVFSFGVLLCQLLARVDADPDVLPRADNFGLDYGGFVRLCGARTPPRLLRLAFRCCIYDPNSRPLFPEIEELLTELRREQDAAPDRDALDGWGPPARTAGETVGPRARTRSESVRRVPPDITLPRRASTPPPTTSHSVPACPLRREADLMLLRDPHALRPTATSPARPLAHLRGVRKIVERRARPRSRSAPAIGPHGRRPRPARRARSAGCAGGCGRCAGGAWYRARRSSAESGVFGSGSESEARSEARRGAAPDDSALSTTTGGSARSLDELDAGCGRCPRIARIVDYFERQGACPSRPAPARAARPALCTGAVRSKLPLFDAAS